MVAFGRREGVSLALAGIVLSLGSAGSARADTSTDAVVYVVGKGDTLIDLARKYLVNTGSYHRVQTLNHLASPTRMPVGLHLYK